jgi:hypothetical protein
MIFQQRWVLWRSQLPLQRPLLLAQPRALLAQPLPHNQVLQRALHLVRAAEAGADPVEAELWSVGASVPMPAALLLVELELALPHNQVLQRALHLVRAMLLQLPHFSLGPLHCYSDYGA